MQIFYNSDSFAVVEFDGPTMGRGGYEIVDKLARKEIFIEGLVAETFKTGVQAIVEQDAGAEALDEFIGRYTQLAQQPLVAH